MEMLLEYSSTEYMHIVQNVNLIGCYGNQKDKMAKTWELKG